MRLLAGLQAMAVLCPLLVYACLAAVARLSQPAQLAVVGQVLFPLLAVLCGVLGGFQFPVASRVFFARADGPRRGSIGSLYGLDLAGSCAGAIVFSAYLIPVYGFLKTSLLLALVNLVPALLAAASMREAGAPRKPPSERGQTPPP
jgi:predicted membrane-bound spermidine synthase